MFYFSPAPRIPWNLFFARTVFCSALLAGLLSLFGGQPVAAAPSKEVLINGAGATFPYPLYAKWFSKYNELHPAVKINYQSIGSGGGITQLQNRTVDFGASDAFMNSEEIRRNPEPVLHLPTVMGAVVLIYNLKEVSKPLRLSREATIGIFEGKITKWNDPILAKANPGVKLPDAQIVLVTRSDGSGTTAVFTDYLAKLDPEFAGKFGKGKVAKWPSGVSGKGNEGVAGLVQQNPGAIGYTELVYAKENKLTMAEVQNAAGEYVQPSVQAIVDAAGSVQQVPEDFNVSITNAPGKKSYPIAAYTYLLIFQSMPKPKGEEIVKFLEWAYGPGQRMAPDLHYAPLPEGVRKKVQAKVKTITLTKAQ